MSKFPITLDDVHADIRQKGHRWHPAQTSMAMLEHGDALKRLGYTPRSDVPILTERERRAAAAAGAGPHPAGGSGSASGTAASGTAAPGTAAPGTAAPGTAAPDTSVTAGAAAP